MVLFHIQDYVSARQYLLEAAKSSPENSIALYYLMNSYLKEGNDKEAFKLVPDILKYSPGAITDLIQN
jgi:hypothetical protein